jgi:hypothetical protein
VNTPAVYRYVRAVKTISEYFFIGELRVFAEPAPVVRRWIFVQGMDSPGGDIGDLGGDKPSDGMIAVADATPGCIAFNTAGYYKNVLKPRDQWRPWGEGPAQGLWVLRRWVFVQGMDSPGGDIGDLGGNKPSDAMIAVADATPGCIAFNTAGYYKNVLKPRDQWRPWGEGPAQGLWVLDLVGVDVSDLPSAPPPTPPAPTPTPPAPQLVNVAAGKPAVASSEWSAEHSASHANPIAHPGTGGWSPRGEPEQHWWQVDLGQPHLISRIELVTRQEGDQPDTRRNFALWLSNDPDMHDHVVVGQRDGVSLPFQATFIADVNTPALYRHVRAIKTTPEYFFIGELRVFAEPAPVVRRWIFVQGMDSPGGDIGDLGGDKPSDGMIAVADATPGCIAFNTAGYYKNVLKPRDQWRPWGEGPAQGLWVLRRWVFVQGMDSPGGDIGDLGGNKPSDAMIAVADATPGCIAFNTAGYYKNVLKPRDQWRPWGEGPAQGLWVLDLVGVDVCDLPSAPPPTPPAPTPTPPAPQLVNVAAGKPAVASSEWSAEHSASHANPVAHPGTGGWSPRGEPEQHWWQVDLGQPHLISRIELVTRQEGDQSDTRRNFALWLSNDPDMHDHVVVGQRDGVSLPFQATFIADVNTPALYRHVRAIKTTPEYFFIGELRVFAEPAPTIASLPTSSHPAAPVGMMMAVDGMAPHCPVLQWNEITYWPYSFQDNRTAMGIVGYDAAGNICCSLAAPGARYISRITVESDAKTVTFWGQDNSSAVVTWAALKRS